MLSLFYTQNCLTRLGLCCVDWYDMVSDNYFRTLIASLFERITRPDWCAAGLCSHGECVTLRREATHAGPSDDGGECDGWLREPDDEVMTQAYFDAKCAGDDGDWADLTYDNLYY